MAIYGTTGDDSNLKGGSGDDDIYGYAGNDTIDGGDGNDNIYGGTGNDVIDGNLGNDTIDGGAGNDKIDGSYGNDIYLFGKGDGQDELIWGQFNDYPSNSKLNTLQFKAGVLPSDVTATRSGDNLILSISGTTDSFIVQDFYSDNLAGTNPHNQLQQVTFVDAPTNIWDLTTLSNKAFVRGTGNDTFKGTLEDDTFDGGAGNDVIDGADGNDTYLFGKGDGQDILRENDIGSRNQAKTSILKFKAGVMPSDVTVTRVGDDVILSITSTSDSFTAKGFFYLNNQGSTIQNRLQQVEFADNTTWNLVTLSNKAFVGTANSDSFNGTDKDDIFDGGAGNDQINGNLGNDTYLFGKGDGQDVLHDESRNNSTTIKLNTLKFKAGVMPSEVTAERSGDDLILRITGTNDTFNASNFFYTNQPGTASYNKLQQVKFADDPTIWNFNTLSNKAFEGTIGNDTFKGTKENDIFDGGAGKDVIDGNLGNDTYLFGKGDGQDLLLANQSAESSFNPLNILQFKANVLPSEITATRSGNDLILSITGTNDSFTAQSFFYDNNQGSSLFNQLQQVQFADGSPNWEIKEISNKAFVGTVGNDTFKGTKANDTFNGGAGDDVIDGNLGNDIYQFGKGDGKDVLLQGPYGDNQYNKLNILEFKAGVLPSEIITKRSGDDLILSISGTLDSFKVNSFFDYNGVTSALSKLQQINFANGTAWNLDAIFASISYNHAPIIATAIPDFTASEDIAINYQISANSFTDYDNGDTLSYSASLSNGAALPGWLNFNPATRTFTGTPIASAVGTLNVIVTATDSKNASVAENFAFNIAHINHAPFSSGSIITTPKNTEHIFTLGDFGFSDSDAGDSLKSISVVNLPAAGNLKLNDKAVIVGQTISSREISTELLKFTPNKDASSSNYAGFDFKVSDGVLFSETASLINIKVTTTGTGKNEILQGSNNWNDIIKANQGKNTLYGYSGDDELYGKDGKDTLYGGLGDDYLDGGKDIDKMYGGTGNDTYIVDNINDKVIEGSDPGIDVIKSSVNFKLPDNVEKLSLLEYHTAKNGIGNSGNNLITGNQYPNTLSGAAGKDTLKGGEGNDTLLGGNGDDVLYGEIGRDKLVGGAGNDTIDGGAGNDTFKFSPHAGKDKIYNFAHTTGNLDKIDLKDFHTSYNKLKISSHEHDTVITINGINENDFEITLVGVTTIDRSDFDF